MTDLQIDPHLESLKIPECPFPIPEHLQVTGSVFQKIAADFDRYTNFYYLPVN